MTNRRSLLAAAAAALLPVSLARAQGAGIGDIRVDLSPLRAKGWGGAPLSVVDANLRNALRASFGDRLGGGLALVVRIDAIQLAAYAGTSAARGGGRLHGGGGGDNDQMDYMEGELLLLGRGGSIVSREPMLNALSAVSSGAWWDPANELKRLAALSTSYAHWARRKLG